MASLLAWREAALAAVEAVGDAWAQQDDGPSAEDLQTELSWLLDDSVAGLLRDSSGGSGSSGQAGGSGLASASGRAGAAAAASMTWRRVERDLRSPALAAALLQQIVQLRAPLEALDALWRRRLEQRVPLQYLTSSAHWRDVVLSVGPGILIPRPETEQMIDFAAEAAAARPELAAGRWADLGTGSGALAVGLARQLPSVPQVWAVDLNPAAVAYATFNAQRLGVAGRVAAVQGSWYQPLLAAGVGQLAGILSNPPYITSEQMAGLQAEVGRHEPHLALDGGSGLGIACLEPICAGAVAMLQPGGFLALETGGGEQAHYVAEMLRRLRAPQPGSSGGGGGEAPNSVPAFEDVRVRRDLFGVDRFVTAMRSQAAGEAGAT